MRKTSNKFIFAALSTGLLLWLLLGAPAEGEHKDHHGNSGDVKNSTHEDLQKKIADLRAQAARLESGLQSKHKEQLGGTDAVMERGGMDESGGDEHSKHHGGGEKKSGMGSMMGNDSMGKAAGKNKGDMGSMMGDSSMKKPPGNEHSKHHGGGEKEGGMGSMMGNDSMGKTGDEDKGGMGSMMANSSMDKSGGDEHSKHHGGGAKKSGMGGMGAMMGKMMEQMGAPKPKDLYPSLMALPDLPAEERVEIDRKAHDRMNSGAELMSKGLKDLSQAAPTDSFDSMQKASEVVREGLAQFDSGLAAHRAIAEGKAPRNIALNWFKKEMSLLPTSSSTDSGAVFGMSWFHFSVMVLLVVFSVSMIVMYFFKMRRAEKLLKKIAADAESGNEKPGQENNE